MSVPADRPRALRGLSRPARMARSVSRGLPGGARHQTPGHDMSIPAASDVGSSATFHDPTGGGFPLSREGRVLFWIAVAFSVFQLATAAHVVTLPSQIVRAFRARDLVDCATALLRARPDAIIARPGQRFRRM